MRVDVTTETWRAVSARAREAIETSRTRLEGRHMTPDDTMLERGRIIAMREILDMGAPVELPGRPLAAHI
jgi:hypothetical protein